MGNGVRYTEDEAREIQQRLSRKREVTPTSGAAGSKQAPEGQRARREPQSAKPPNRHVVRLEQQLSAHGFPLYVKEYFAIPGRDFRLDYAWPALKVGIELQGVHHRERGKYARDIEKRALHLIAGWRVLELDGKSIKAERSVEWLVTLLDGAS